MVNDELSKRPDSTTLGAYSSFDGSLFSQGKFQFDLWNVSPYYDWAELRKSVMLYSTRNMFILNRIILG